MLIGNRQTIAVQYELDESHGNAWMLGRICYWINGSQIGDYDLGTSLRDVLFQLKYLVSDSGNRQGNSLCSLSPEEAFHSLDGALYGKPDKSIAALPDTPSRFDIGLQVDVFDHWKIFLIDCSSCSLVLYKRLDQANVSFASIPKGEFDTVITTLSNDLNCIYESIAASPRSSE
jgi:hypothetical protein